MLKTFSAIAIAASILAAPAMAAGPAKTTDKTTTSAPVVKPAEIASKQQVKPNVLNAQAKMVRHHHRHVRHHHRFHNKMGMHKTFKHTAVKTTAAHIKRG